MPDIKGTYSTEEIKDGFEKFLKENGHYPTAPEIDNCGYLPSARQTQRNFGGLPKFRELIGLSETDFGKGKFRSEIATRANVRGRDAELVLEKILRKKFGEVFIHTEKIFDDSKNRVDFYVYSPDGNFGVDVFSTETMRDLQKNINIKIDKYQKFPQQLFLVVGNNNFEQKELDNYMASKIKALPPHTVITTIQTLLDRIKERRSYPDPLIK